MSTTNQATKSALRDDGVGEERISVFGYSIGGHDQGIGVIAPVNKLIEVFCMGLGKFLHSSSSSSKNWAEIPSLSSHPAVSARSSTLWW